MHGATMKFTISLSNTGKRLNFFEIFLIFSYKESSLNYARFDQQNHFLELLFW